MRKLAATLITASLLALFHILVVVVPVISSGGNGEGQAFAVIVFDFPLVQMLLKTPGGRHILYNNTDQGTFLFCVGGTLMYGCVGALIGLLIDAIRSKFRQPASISN